MCNSKIIVALDFDNENQVYELVEQLNPSQCRLKVGKELFTYLGPSIVKYLIGRGFDVFLDLKFHDIPNTVAKACIAAADLGVWMLNVHASGGLKMMSHAQTELDKRFKQPPKLIAVTVLTSMDKQQLSAIVPQVSIQEQVLKLAHLTNEAGLDGVVCSAMEADLMRNNLPQSFELITPGIRPAGSVKDDQTRIVTPAEAVGLGVNYMVIGRPITQSASPVMALDAMNREIKEAES